MCVPVIITQFAGWFCFFYTDISSCGCSTRMRCKMILWMMKVIKMWYYDNKHCNLTLFTMLFTFLSSPNFLKWKWRGGSRTKDCSRTGLLVCLHICLSLPACVNIYFVCQPVGFFPFKLIIFFSVFQLCHYALAPSEHLDFVHTIPHRF